MDIPGISESGWTWDEHTELSQNQTISLYVQCREIVQKLEKDPSIWPFLDPVNI